MITAPLFERVHVTLDATGAGRAQLGPQHTRERWTVHTITVRVSPAVLVPSARLYRGTVCDSTYTGHGTFTGHQDTATFTNGLELQAGEYLTMVWADGDPGAAATMEYRGEKEVG